MANFASAKEALDFFSLVAVDFDELSARLINPDAVEEVVSVDAHLDMGMQYRVSDEGLQFKIRCVASSSMFSIEVVARVTYEAAEPFDMNADAVEEFANTVAFMSGFPYIRQAVFDLSSRLGTPFTLPVVRAGQMNFTF